MSQGAVWKYGDNVNTDVIYPGRYSELYDPAEMAKHAMEDLDPAFRDRVRAGDVIVAGAGGVFFGRSSPPIFGDPTSLASGLGVDRLRMRCGPAPRWAVPRNEPLLPKEITQWQ